MPRAVFTPSVAAIATIAAFAALAATPHPALAARLDLSGVVRAAGGGPVADGNYIFFVTLYDGQKATKALWSETLKSVWVGGGFFSVALGAAATPLPDAVLAGSKPLWVGVQVGNDPELPRVPIREVARAVYASKAAGLACSGCVGTEAIAVGAVSSKQVGFLYAGSDSKGGPAKTALLADKAKVAAQAMNATNATNASHAIRADKAVDAKTAQQAGHANTADDAKLAFAAKALQCTGCVGLAHLGGEVTGAFLSTKGGKVSGKLRVDGQLSLGHSTIVGGSFAPQDLKKVSCTASTAGQLVFDAATKSMYLCNGSALVRFRTCSTACRAKAKVACGQPVPDDCGDLGVCTGTGSFCAGGAPCQDGKCLGPGEAAGTALASCKAILDKAPGSKDGTYWIKPGGVQPYQAYCDMSHDGGGWTRLLHHALRHGTKVTQHTVEAGGSFTSIRATHVSGYIACHCGSKDVSHPWQACNPSHGDVYSLEYMLNGKYLLQQTGWSTLPAGCAKPVSKAAPILCTKTFTTHKGDSMAATWLEASRNTSTGDNCGTQVVDVWGR